MAVALASCIVRSASKLGLAGASQPNDQLIAGNIKEVASSIEVLSGRSHSGKLAHVEIESAVRSFAMLNPSRSLIPLQYPIFSALLVLLAGERAARRWNKKAQLSALFSSHG